MKSLGYFSYLPEQFFKLVIFSDELVAIKKVELVVIRDEMFFVFVVSTKVANVVWETYNRH